MNTWTLSFDGLCEPNPDGVMGLGFLIDEITPKGEGCGFASTRKGVRK